MLHIPLNMRARSVFLAVTILHLSSANSTVSFKSIPDCARQACFPFHSASIYCSRLRQTVSARNLWRRCNAHIEVATTQNGPRWKTGSLAFVPTLQLWTFRLCLSVDEPVSEASWSQMGVRLSTRTRPVSINSTETASADFRAMGPCSRAVSPQQLVVGRRRWRPIIR
jgi:hypothetical protein